MHKMHLDVKEEILRVTAFTLIFKDDSILYYGRNNTSL